MCSGWHARQAFASRSTSAHVLIHDDAHAAARTSERTALSHALHDGEDHELIATFDGDALPHGWHAIGRVVRGAGLALVEPSGGQNEWTRDQGGWQH